MKVLGVKEFTESNKIWSMLCAEFLGTFLLVLVGCGSIMYADKTAFVVQIALTFGLLIFILAQSLGHVSGGHFNPAVTLSFLIIGKCSILKTVCYILMQCAGATAGFYVLLMLTPRDAITNNLGNTSLGNNVTVVQGIVIEAIGTFILVLVIHSVTDERKSADTKIVAPLSIGITIAVCHLFAIRYTGSSLNPARSLGPTIVYGIWHSHGVYWVGPILGGCIAALLYRMLFQVKKGEEEANSYDFP